MTEKTWKEAVTLASDPLETYTEVVREERAGVLIGVESGVLGEVGGCCV
jgi:hypothetical protein